MSLATQREIHLQLLRVRGINYDLREALEQFVEKWPAGRVSEETLYLARAALKAAKEIGG